MNHVNKHRDGETRLLRLTECLEPEGDAQDLNNPRIKFIVR